MQRSPHAPRYCRSVSGHAPAHALHATSPAPGPTTTTRFPKPIRCAYRVPRYDTAYTTAPALGSELGFCCEFVSACARSPRPFGRAADRGFDFRSAFSIHPSALIHVPFPCVPMTGTVGATGGSMRPGLWAACAVVGVSCQQVAAQVIQPLQLDEVESVYAPAAPPSPDEGINAGGVNFSLD